MPFAASLVSRLTAGRSPETLALTALLFGGAALLALALIAPPSPDAPVALGYAVLPLALVMAAGTLWAGDGLPRTVLLGEAILAVVLNSVLVAAASTRAGAIVDAIAYGWLTVYVALFFPRATSAFVALVAAGFGVGLLASDLPAMLTPWLLVVITTTFVAAVVAAVSRAVRRRMVTDSLTGVLNREGLEAAKAGIERRRRHSDQPLAVAMLDLDGFKLVNDREGHAAGDGLLADASAAWRASLRGSDVLARVGGDEFVVLMPGTTTDQAATVLDRLRHAHPIAVSVGVASWRAGETLDDCMARADLRLYAQKAARTPDE
jgi:diguanylate cyclase (GGDEF)-like protein